MTANIKFAKVHPDAKIPTKRREDAGWDVYPCFESDWIEIPPFESKLVPTGIASALDEDWAFIFRERGSTGTKNIKVSAGVIDSGFNGQWFVCIYNGNKVPLFISKIGETGEQSPLTEHPGAILYPYDKAIAQALLVHVPDTNEEVVDYEEIKNRETKRGMGQLGSTNV
jgi:dUTP pyrophosphatase